MEHCQGARHVTQELADLVPRQPIDLVQARAREELHRVIGSVFVDSVIEHRDDARVFHAGERVKLALEVSGRGRGLRRMKRRSIRLTAIKPPVRSSRA